MPTWWPDLWIWLLGAAIVAGTYALRAARGDLYKAVKSKLWPPPIAVDTSVGHPLVTPELERLSHNGIQTEFVRPLKRLALEAEGWTLVEVRVGLLRRPQHFYSPTQVVNGGAVEDHWLLRGPEQTLPGGSARR